MPEAITDTSLHETTRERYLNYALSVITSRALPDVRDGLKPVQRRILYAMFHNLRLLPEAKFRKSAAVVGEVMAKYHPHGDQSIYDAMVRMAQSFALRYPLVDGHGNFGSVDGDGAAAMRYTEARLQHLALELLEELKKQTVDLRPNYDGTFDEPVVLPAQVPNLLINGATGIAVGMATHIPPHNLGEVVGACIRLIDEVDTPFEAIAGPIIRGPDFPTAGEILNDVESIRDIYRTGRGAIELRGTWRVETENRKRWLIVDSIPYGLNKSQLIGDVAEHIRRDRIPQILDVRDESTDDVRIVMELKRGANPEAAMAWLFKRTALAGRFNVNLTALCPLPAPGGEGAGKGAELPVCQPRRVTLMELLRQFLGFRLEVVNRRLRFDLGALEKRIHLLEGFEILFDALDEAITLIRASDGKAGARDKLMARFELDWEQAEAILETKLYRLAKLEIEEIRRELAEKRAAAAELRAILASPERQWALIRDELLELQQAYADPRRTRITGPVQEKAFSEQTYIVKEDTFVIVTRAGWFKRQKSYTDLSSIRVREGDEVGWVVPSDSRESIILFSDGGRAYTMRCADIPLTTGYGEAIQTRFGFADGERVVGVAATDRRVLPMMSDEVLATITEDDPTPPYLVAITRAGRGMRMSLEPFEEPSTVSGRLFMRLDNRRVAGDAVTAVYVSDGSELVSLATRRGRVLVFAVGEIKVLVHAGKGVLAIRLDPNDLVLGFCLATHRMEGLEVTTNRGRTEVIRPNKFRPMDRATKGRAIITKGHLTRVRWRPVEWHFPELREEVEAEVEAEIEEEIEEDFEEDQRSAEDASGGARDRGDGPGQARRRPRGPTTVAQLAAEVGVVVQPEIPSASRRNAEPGRKAVRGSKPPATPESPATPKSPATPRRSGALESNATPQTATTAGPSTARITAPIGPRPKSRRIIKPGGTPDGGRDRLGRIARIAVERYKKCAKTPPDDDPNQGSLF